jgi:hypothetical protein
MWVRVCEEPVSTYWQSSILTSCKVGIRLNNWTGGKARCKQVGLTDEICGRTRPSPATPSSDAYKGRSSACTARCNPHYTPRNRGASRPAVSLSSTEGCMWTHQAGGTLVRGFTCNWPLVCPFNGVRSWCEVGNPAPYSGAAGWTSGVQFPEGKMKGHFLFATAPRSALGPTQPRIKCVPGFFPQEKAAAAWSCPLASI